MSVLRFAFPEDKRDVIEHFASDMEQEMRAALSSKPTKGEMIAWIETWRTTTKTIINIVKAPE
jgi:hypothetical protein